MSTTHTVTTITKEQGEFLRELAQAVWAEGIHPGSSRISDRWAVIGDSQFSDSNAITKVIQGLRAQQESSMKDIESYAAGEHAHLYSSNTPQWSAGRSLLETMLNNKSRLPGYVETEELHNPVQVTMEDDPDLGEIPATEADWTNFFETAVREPGFDDFVNTIQPQIEEAFAGAGPRWSSMRSRAVQEALRKFTMDMNAKHSEYAHAFLVRVKEFKDAMLQRRAALRSERNKTNAMLVDKMEERRQNVYTQRMDRYLRWLDGAAGRAVQLLSGPVSYFAETRLKDYLQRCMAGMQSGELWRNVRTQKHVAAQQQWLMNRPLLNPGIQYIAAMASQPLKAAFAVPEPMRFEQQLALTAIGGFLG